MSILLLLESEYFIQHVDISQNVLYYWSKFGVDCEVKVAYQLVIETGYNNKRLIIEPDTRTFLIRSF